MRTAILDFPDTRHAPPMALILYQRDDCQLCDLALDVLAHAHAPDFDSVFIDDDATLQARYGIRVPVLRDEASDTELDWPFDAETLRRWLLTVSAMNSTRRH